MEGFVVIDKPRGPTSHQIDYWVRSLTGEQRVGHVGTLDPNATGVLVMALGRATRLIDIVHESSKEYIFVIEFHSSISTESIQEVINLFRGNVYQIPPERSAVARRLRVRKIHTLDLLEVSGKRALMRTVCDSGTYIRTLCVDMGYAVGTGAHMVELRRIATGPFREEHMVTLQDFSDALKLLELGVTSELDKILLPVDFLFRDTPKIIVKRSSLRNISHGSDLYPGGIRAVIGRPKRGDRVCLLSEDNEVIGTGKMLVSYDDIDSLKVVDLERVLIEPIGGGERTEKGGQRENILVRKKGGRGDLPVQRTSGGSRFTPGKTKKGRGATAGKRSDQQRKHPRSQNRGHRDGKKTNKRRVHR